MHKCISPICLCAYYLLKAVVVLASIIPTIPASSTIQKLADLLNIDGLLLSQLPHAGRLHAKLLSPSPLHFVLDYCELDE